MSDNAQQYRGCGDIKCLIELRADERRFAAQAGTYKYCSVNWRARHQTTHYYCTHNMHRLYLILNLLHYQHHLKIMPLGIIVTCLTVAGYTYSDTCYLQQCYNLLQFRYTHQCTLVCMHVVYWFIAQQHAYIHQQYYGYCHYLNKL